MHRFSNPTPRIFNFRSDLKITLHLISEISIIFYNTCYKKITKNCLLTKNRNSDNGNTPFRTSTPIRVLLIFPTEFKSHKLSHNIEGFHSTSRSPQVQTNNDLFAFEPSACAAIYLGAEKAKQLAGCWPQLWKMCVFVQNVQRYALATYSSRSCACVYIISLIFWRRGKYIVFSGRFSPIDAPTFVCVDFTVVSRFIYLIKYSFFCEKHNIRS